MLPALFTVLAAASLASPSAANSAQALLASLRARYPLVEHWSIRPLTHVEENGAVAPQVVQLGARSAVRIGNRVVWYAVSGVQRVVLATHWIAAGSSTDTRAGRMAETDILPAACDPVTDLSRLRGSRTTRAVQANAVICRDAIERKPPVGRGDEVTVRYVGRFVSLTTRAVAQEDGAVGETLRVRSIHHDDVFAAVVSGVDEVTVHE